jgi:hypothetical protein
MTPEQFAYWLQGYAEMNGSPPSPEQWNMIKAHLATVFRKVTPPLPSIPRKSFEEMIQDLQDLQEQTVEAPVWPIGPKIIC